MRKTRKNKKYRRLTILIFIGIIGLMTAGYAAFQTSLNISAKGNIINTPEECFEVSDNGDGTGTITNYDESCGSKVKIPDTINNLTITRIGDGSGTGENAQGPFTRKNITSVMFPDTLNYIGKIAFFRCRLTTLEIPSNVRVIGFQAFTFNDLTSVTLNEGLEAIGQEAFTGNNLTTIYIPRTVTSMTSAIASANLMEGDNAFVYNHDENGNINLTELNSYGNRNSTEIIFPDNIKVLGHLSLYSMGNLEILNIPDTVETLDAKFIYRMPSLTTINIGSGIKNIDAEAFIGKASMPNLTTININRKKDAIAGAPWGASGVTINWTGTK